MKKYFFGSLLCLALLGQGCLFPASRISQPASSEKPAPAPAQAPAEPQVSDLSPQTSASTYEPFTKAKYDEARAAGKPILLYFYAKWCPSCREQDPRLLKVVPMHTGGVAAFRVNFNDFDTDADEKALAKEFGVAYQHTGFFIGRDGQTKKKTIGTITDAQTTEYLDPISK